MAAKCMGIYYAEVWAVMIIIVMIINTQSFASCIFLHKHLGLLLDLYLFCMDLRLMD